MKNFMAIEMLGDGNMVEHGKNEKKKRHDSIVPAWLLGNSTLRKMVEL